MLTLRSIKLTNFLSHASTEVKFDNNSRLLIDGKSGSGKSSIVEALIWVVYGKGRSDNRGLVKHGKKMARVMLKLEDYDKKTDQHLFYNIERSVSDKGKQGVEVAVSGDGENFRPFPFSGLKEAQEWLEKKLVKSSYLLFINSVAYPQDNQENFVKQTATRRKELLLEIANVEDYDGYYEKAKNALSEAESKVAEAKTKMAVNEDYVSRHKEGAAKLPGIKLELSQAESAVNELTAKISVIKAFKEVLGEKLGTLQLKLAERANLENKISFINSQNSSRQAKITEYSSVDDSGLDEKIAELDKFRNEVADREAKERFDADCQAKMNAVIASKPSEIDYDKEIESLNGQIMTGMLNSNNHCEELGRDCPTLVKRMEEGLTYLRGQVETKTKAKEAQVIALKEYQERLAAVPKKIADPDNYAKLLEARAKVVEYSKYATQKETAALRQQMVDTLKKEIEESNGQLLVISMEIEAHNSQIKKLELEIEQEKQNPVLAKEQETEVDLRLAQDRVSNLKAQASVAEMEAKACQEAEAEIMINRQIVDGSKDAIESLSLIKEAFGARGIRITVVDYLLPRLEEKINEILGQLSDFRISLDTQKSSANGESVIEGLYINIYNELGEQFSFENYSGGEKLKISVAISEALASLQRVGFRILDEVFVGLDHDATMGFAAVLEKLQTNFAQTICISHLREIKDLFERSITIQKMGGNSVII